MVKLAAYQPYSAPQGQNKFKREKKQEEQDDAFEILNDKDSLEMNLYKAIASRLLAFEHITPPVTAVKRITGREDEVVPGFKEEADLMIDPMTASKPQLEDWKRENHLGSPASILFSIQGASTSQT